eukprot:989867-Rhodomonas_salina.1
MSVLQPLVEPPCLSAMHTQLAEYPCGVLRLLAALGAKHACASACAHTQSGPAYTAVIWVRLRCCKHGRYANPKVQQAIQKAQGSGVGWGGSQGSGSHENGSLHGLPGSDSLLCMLCMSGYLRSIMPSRPDFPRCVPCMSLGARDASRCRPGADGSRCWQRTASGTRKRTSSERTERGHRMTEPDATAASL